MRDYRLVRYKNKNYYVCRYKKRDGTSRLFLIDREDLATLKRQSERSWYKINGFVGYAEKVKKKTRHCYLHNLVMKKQMAGGSKGRTRYNVRHISGNTHDNRKSNLKFDSERSRNKTKQKRSSCKLPKSCGIKPSDIPKSVYYCKPQSGHGAVFVIELKKNGKRKIWKSSSSKKISLKDKLIEIKQKLLDISSQYPELMEGKNIIENYSDAQLKLMKEFNDIIKLSGYKCYKQNLVKIPKKKVLRPNVTEAGAVTKKYIKTLNTAIKTGRRHKNNLPSSCRITPGMIPKYCYYQQKTNKRGDAFVIDRHPKLPRGQRQWSTTSSRAVSTKDKFHDLLDKLGELRSNPVKYESKTSRPKGAKKRKS